MPEHNENAVDRDEADAPSHTGPEPTDQGQDAVAGDVDVRRLERSADRIGQATERPPANLAPEDADADRTR